MNILNIINFIRAFDPREPDADLHLPVRKQLEFSQKYQFPTTFLLQYDSLLDERYFELLNNQPNIEIGVWLEVMQPLVESIGIPWRGRDAWDWHSHVGFSVGYTPDERKRIADELMRKFKEVFGYYPKTVGSWLIDIVTLNYLSEKYGIVASCNCKDQWGTDGYTLWGGYYNQAYYPSKFNVFAPASTVENQVNVPVFRMLGSDPVDQYDLDIGGDWQGVMTLEPVYKDGGGNEEWVKWFLGEIYNGKSLSFGYTQAGQENSFGWDNMKVGYELQMKLFDQLKKENKISIMTLAETGEWFKKTYPTTPVSSIVAKKENKDSVWYCGKNYRSNFYVKDGIPRIRDIFFFNELYKERYLNDVCAGMNMTYDNLPVIDGNRWSVEGNYAGIYFADKSEIVKLNGEIETFCENDTLRISAENIEVIYSEDKIEINTTFRLVYIMNAKKSETKISIDGDRIRFEHNNFTYALKTNAKITQKGENIEFESNDNKIIFEFMEDKS